jgi:hypothetical protein
MELIGTIEPGIGVATGKPEWLRLIDTHPQLSSVPDQPGINPFTRAPVSFKARPDSARVLLEQRHVGQISWAMDDSRRLVVSSDTGFEDKVANIAQDVASRLGWRFVPVAAA